MADRRMVADNDEWSFNGFCYFMKREQDWDGRGTGGVGHAARWGGDAAPKGGGAVTRTAQ
jgi:hypothetical protein